MLQAWPRLWSLQCVNDLQCSVNMGSDLVLPPPRPSPVRGPRSALCAFCFAGVLQGKHFGHLAVPGLLAKMFSWYFPAPLVCFPGCSGLAGLPGPAWPARPASLRPGFRRPGLRPPPSPPGACNSRLVSMFWGVSSCLSGPVLKS